MDNKTTTIFCLSEIKIRMWKLYRFPIKIASKKYIETTWIFRPSKLCWINFVKMRANFLSSKLGQTNYVKTTCIFGPSKLRRGKFDETTSVIGSSKLHLKSASKWRENSLICFFNVSTYYWHRINVYFMWCVRWVDHTKQSATDALKTTSTRIIQKKEATGRLMHNKIAN